VALLGGIHCIVGRVVSAASVGAQWIEVIVCVVVFSLVCLGYCHFLLLYSSLWAGIFLLIGLLLVGDPGASPSGSSLPLRLRKCAAAAALAATECGCAVFVLLELYFACVVLADEDVYTPVVSGSLALKKRCIRRRLGLIFLVISCSD
jgi:hypothetical protein